MVLRCCLFYDSNNFILNIWQEFFILRVISKANVLSVMLMNAGF
jgi:hypothetical protein